MTKLIQAISWAMNTIANFFDTLFQWIVNIISFFWWMLDTIMYSIKTIFSLFTSLF